MVTVQIQGWRVGYNKVASTQILKKLTNLGLEESYRFTHTILEDNPVSIEVENLPLAEQLVRELNEIGANAEIAQQPRPSA